MGLYWFTASPTMTSMPRKTGLAHLPILEPKRVAVVFHDASKDKRALLRASGRAVEPRGVVESLGLHDEPTVGGR
jgi:hypothetical protein